MWPFKKNLPRTPEQIQKDMEEAQNKAIQAAARLKKLTLASGSGWQDYYELINEYIKSRQVRKLNTSLDTANSETIDKLKLADREIRILKWALQVPQQFIKGLEAEQKKKQEEEESEDA